MADNLNTQINEHIPVDIPGLVCDIVYNHIKTTLLEKTDSHVHFARPDVYCVWFAFTLGNYKALVSTTLPDGRYYEITYDKAHGRSYIDTYVKVDNVALHHPKE